jgi:hypothetical protein
MTPQRWKGAGILFLAITALLAIASLVSVLAVGVSPLPGNGPDYATFVPATLLGVDTGLLRGVVLGAFAGVAFFLGLACFMWSGLAEAKAQRAEILSELTALRVRADKTAAPERPGS